MPISITSVLQLQRRALRPARPFRRARRLIGASLGLLFLLGVGLLPSVLAGGSAGQQPAIMLGGAHDAPPFGSWGLAILGVVSITLVGAAVFAALARRRAPPSAS